MADTYPDITPLDIIPYIILCIPLFMAIQQIRSGLKYGEMQWFRRGAGSGDGADGPYLGTVRKDKQPKTFWSLFIFYCLIIAAVPALIVASLLFKAGMIDWPLR
jgi:hypothetical protein